MSESTGYTGPSAYQIASEVRRELQSELNTIKNNISVTNNNVQIVNSRVDEVDEKVLVIYREMLAFIREQRMANRLNQAETRIGTIQQELEKKYGHYGGRVEKCLNFAETLLRPC
jgi:tetrahydromethanopterin S-methyltransferase subunit G